MRVLEVGTEQESCGIWVVFWNIMDSNQTVLNYEMAFIDIKPLKCYIRYTVCRYQFFIIRFRCGRKGNKYIGVPADPFGFFCGLRFINILIHFFSFCERVKAEWKWMDEKQSVEL